MRFSFLGILLFINCIANGQVLLDVDHYRNKLDDISYTNKLPEGLLQGKSAVIHAYPSAQSTYKEKAAALQPELKNAGIDAVSHYLFEDIFSGVEPVEAYKQQLRDREIDFLIYYIDKNQKRIIISPFEDSLFVDQAFSMIQKDTETLGEELYLKSARSGQEMLNLLILDVPSYPEFPEIIEGRRAEFYDLNMKSAKVAIPRTEDSLVNKAIDSIMAAYYPYKYGFVEPGASEADLRKDGYWFKMYAIHGSGVTVRRLLEYESSTDETAYASIVADGRETDVKTIGIEKPVYKFYIKDTQKGDNFLGKHYDADETWEQALINYILNLKNILN